MGDGPATIEAVLPRISALVRKSSGESRPQLLAANIDVVFIVTAADGDFNLPRIERYLALVSDSGAAPVIVLNKADLEDVIGLAGQIVRLRLACRSTPSAHPRRRADLERYFVATAPGLIIPRAWASQLTNSCWDAPQATGSPRATVRRHTTTHRQLFTRPQGGALIDTPGMRGVERWNTAQVVDNDFEDIEVLALACKFRNCGMTAGCAVRAPSGEAISKRSSGDYAARRPLQLSPVASTSDRMLAASRGRRMRGPYPAASMKSDIWLDGPWRPWFNGSRMRLLRGSARHIVGVTALLCAWSRRRTSWILVAAQAGRRGSTSRCASRSTANSPNTRAHDA
jgi:ribosome biogenesis GTPase